jgi:hypothetical protein
VLVQYDLTNAWPSKLVVRSIEAGNTKLSVVTVTFAASSITKVS